MLRGADIFRAWDLDMGEAKRRRLAGQMPYQTAKEERGNLTLEHTTPPWPLPAKVDDFIKSLSNAAPCILPFTELGEGYIARACHLNVAHRIKHHGGERVLGWMIWASSLFVEGEAHAVWKSPLGELLDITPRGDGEELIVFVPDQTLTIEKVGDGARFPLNRTNLPGLRYTSGMQAFTEPYQLRHPDERTRAHMIRLGMPHCAG